jgi:hypothetical protein
MPRAKRKEGDWRKSTRGIAQHSHWDFKFGFGIWVFGIGFGIGFGFVG